MNARLRLVLCSACLVLGVVEARHAMHVFAEDLHGPYDGDQARAVVDARGNLVFVERTSSEDAVLEARLSRPSATREPGSEHGRDRGVTRANDAARRR